MNTMRKNKILFISDFNLSHNIGGAQRSNAILIDQGRKLGFDITEATFEANFAELDFNNFDAVISSNLHAIISLNSDIIDKISKHNFHVRLEHDLNSYLKAEDRVKLFESCKKTVFLTNFHKEVFVSRYGDFYKNVEIIPDPIDPNIFFDKKNERSSDILYVGYMHEAKGSIRFFDFALNNPKRQFVVAGWTDSKLLDFLLNKTPNVKNLGAIPHEKMPELYNSYKEIFYSPNFPEPFCRSVCEALFSGMKMLFNPPNIGCLKEIEKVGLDNYKLECATAPAKFWDLFS
jgi:glycosyltransferase involved in cell wall biosynthesis